MAYGTDQTNTLSMPLPAGTPITNINTWTAPVFASSGVRGGDGNYYFVDAGPPAQLYLFDPGSGLVTLIGSITGLPSGVSVNGIAYDKVNDTYYLCGGVFASTNNLYSLDLGTFTATLVASFPNATGVMIDIAINAATGVGYGYDMIDDNAYSFDPVTGATTLLGSLGYDANYGQGMDIDQATGTIYLSAFNNTTFTGQLRIMDPATGATALVADWGLLQIAPFAINNVYGQGPGPGAATDPNPVNGSTGVEINYDLFWTNPAGATSIEVFWGTSPGTLTSVYSGSPLSTFNPGTMEYFTNYYWKVNETDGTGTTNGSIWHFKTEQNPYIFIDSLTIYPEDVAMWTGNTEGTTKTDGEINTVFPNVGWAVFDINSIPGDAIVNSVRFYGYVNATNWPYWSATAMGTVNPVSDDAGTIYNQIQDNYNQGTAYIFSNEASTFSPGWHSYSLDPNSNYLADFNAVRSQGWFAMGFIDRDLSTTYYVNFDGHNTLNPPYLVVYLDYCLSCVPPSPPSNLTVQQIVNQYPMVQLNWQDNSSDEWGFRILRKRGLPADPGTYMVIETVPTDIVQYIDSTVVVDSTYSYGVRAYNQYGNSDTTNIVSITVMALPVELVSFTAINNNENVILNWKTATETNNKGSEVQRNQIPNIKSKMDWENIGFVDGNGTTTLTHSYSYTDKNVNPGKYYYRLKQIDFNGSYEFSQEVEVEVTAPKEFSLEQNYPNPFNPATAIKYSLKNDGFVSLKVYDILGRQVAVLVNENQKTGYYTINFDASNLPTGKAGLPTGIYIYTLNSAGFTSSKKMLLIK
jgi:hypothetical protein